MTLSQKLTVANLILDSQNHTALFFNLGHRSTFPTSAPNVNDSETDDAVNVLQEFITTKNELLLSADHLVECYTDTNDLMFSSPLSEFFALPIKDNRVTFLTADPILRRTLSFSWVSNKGVIIPLV